MDKPFSSYQDTQVNIALPVYILAYSNPLEGRNWSVPAIEQDRYVLSIFTTTKLQRASVLSNYMY